MQFDFLICSERSGSNLITKMMDAHPQVCGPFPTQAIKTIGPQLFRYGDLQNNDNFKTLLQDTVDYLHAMHSDWQTYPTADELFASVHDRNFGAVLRYAYEKEAQAAGKQRVFVKDNHAYGSIGFIEAHFDDPRYVFVVRDPRDMAATWKYSILTGGLVNAAATWQHDQSESLKVYGYLLSLGRIVLVRFEDLLTQTETELHRICNILKLDYAPEMLDFHKKDIVQKNASQMSAWNDLASPLKKDNFNFYKTQLAAVEIEYIEAVCGELMGYFGYQKEHETTDTPENLIKQLPDDAVSLNDPGHENEQGIFKRWDGVKNRIVSRKLY